MATLAESGGITAGKVMTEASPHVEAVLPATGKLVGDSPPVSESLVIENS